MHAVPQERGYVGFKLTTSTSLNLGDLDLEVSGSGPGHVRNVVPGSSTLGITAPNAFIPTWDHFVLDLLRWLQFSSSFSSCSPS